jgi:hypothetical protein
MSGTAKASAGAIELAKKAFPDGLYKEMFVREGIYTEADAQQSRIAALIDSHLEPLLRAVNKTIEFYDAHGGPMEDLRKEAEKWKPGTLAPATLALRQN